MAKTDNDVEKAEEMAEKQAKKEAAKAKKARKAKIEERKKRGKPWNAYSFGEIAMFPFFLVGPILAKVKNTVTSCLPMAICFDLWKYAFSGTNNCLVYWVTLQYFLCKCNKIFSLDPTIYPYFFNVFCQIVVVVITFFFIWHMFVGKIIITYVMRLWETVATLEEEKTPDVEKLSLTKYCFRRSELLE